MNRQRNIQRFKETAAEADAGAAAKADRKDTDGRTPKKPDDSIFMILNMLLH